MAGAMRPVASQAVAIHSTANWVNGAADDEGQDLAEREAEETGALDRVVGRDHAHAHLRQNQRDDHVEVPASPASTVSVSGRTAGHSAASGRPLPVRRMEEDHAGDGAEHQDHAGDRPDAGVCGRRVADQRLVRPVAGVAKVGLAGTVGGRRPGAPEEERGQRLTIGRITQRIGLHRITPFAQLVKLVGLRRRTGRRCCATCVVAAARSALRVITPVFASYCCAAFQRAAYIELGPLAGCNCV